MIDPPLDIARQGSADLRGPNDVRHSPSDLGLPVKRRNRALRLNRLSRAQFTSIIAAQKIGRSMYA